MNGRMPYFRFYASEWIAKLAPLSRDGRMLALMAAAHGWMLAKSGRCTRTVSEWAAACGCAEIDVLVGASELERQPWAKVESSGKSVTIHLPEMDEQAEIVTYERDKKRALRSRENGGPGTVPGTVPGTRRGREGATKERATGAALAPPKPAAPADDDTRHSVLRTALGRLQ